MQAQSKKRLIISIIALVFVGVLFFIWYQKELQHIFFIDHNYEENYDFESEFSKHIQGYNKVMFNNDGLAPRLIYIKNNKIIGMATRAGAEWGNRKTRYFFDDNEQLNKVIRLDDGNEYQYSYTGGIPVPDLLIILDINKRQTIAYGRTINGEIVESKEWLEMYNAKDYIHYKEKIKSWIEVPSCNTAVKNDCHSHHYLPYR